MRLGPIALAALLASCGEAAPTASTDAGAAPRDVRAPLAACDSPGRQRSAVLATFSFTRADPMRGNVVDGFDLDDYVSSAGDIMGCRQADFTSPDGVRGIDNQIARLLPIVDMMTGGAFDGLIQGAVNNGQLLVAVTMDRVDDLRDDACVSLTFQRVAGTPFVGSDMRIDPGQTFDLMRDQPITRVEGRIRNGVVEAGPFDLALPIAALDARFVVNVKGTRFRATVRDDGAMTGILGGGISVMEFSDTIRSLTIRASEMAAFTGALRLFADLAAGADGMCTQISMGMRFDARPAYVNP